MPANVTQSPWRPTRNRQDFSEELYLKVSVSFPIDNIPPDNAYKITLNTTAGYFELPNYMNGGTAGPLLDEDPNNICGNHCLPQGYKDNNNAIIL